MYILFEMWVARERSPYCLGISRPCLITAWFLYLESMIYGSKLRLLGKAPWLLGKSSSLSCIRGHLYHSKLFNNQRVHESMMHGRIITVILRLATNKLELLQIRRTPTTMALSFICNYWSYNLAAIIYTITASMIYTVYLVRYHQQTITINCWYLVFIYIHSNIYSYIYTYIHCIALHSIPFHYITQHNTTQHNTTQHNTTQHNTTLHYITLHYITLHYITLHTYIHTYIHTYTLYDHK